MRSAPDGNQTVAPPFHPPLTPPSKRAGDLGEEVKKTRPKESSRPAKVPANPGRPECFSRTTSHTHQPVIIDLVATPQRRAWARTEFGDSPEETGG